MNATAANFLKAAAAVVFRWRRLKTSAVSLPYRLFFDYGMLSLRRGFFEHVKGLLDSFFSVGFFAGQRKGWIAKYMKDAVAAENTV